MAGSPLKNLSPNGLCQAKNRRGEPCGVRLDVHRCKNGRLLCRWHGGYSTGPRTPEGKARCGEAGRRKFEGMAFAPTRELRARKEQARGTLRVPATVLQRLGAPNVPGQWLINPRL